MEGTGTALTLFNDFMAATPPIFLRQPGGVLNEAALHDYQYLNRMVAGRDTKKMVSFGSKVKVAIMFDEKSTAQNYKPGESVNFQHHDVIDEVELDHRFTMDYRTWFAPQVEYNSNDMTSKAQDAFFIRLRDVIDTRMRTSLLNHMESQFWQSAHGKAAQMEASSGKVQYSVHAFFSEDTTNFHPDGWTTIQKLDPATEPKYRNPVVTYDYDDPEDLDGDGSGLEEAFEEMRHTLRYRTPRVFQGQAFDPAPDEQRRFIATSLDGIKLYQRVLNNKNDRTRSRTSLGVGDVNYLGVPLERVEFMESEDLYADGSGGFTTEMQAEKDGARYLWLDLNYVGLEFHPNRLFKLHAVREPDDQMDAFAQPVSIWYQNFCRSRRRGGGFISPKN